MTQYPPIQQIGQTITTAGYLMASLLLENENAALTGKPKPISDSDLPDFIRSYNFLVDAETELLKIATRLRGPNDPPPPAIRKFPVPG